MNFCLGLNWVHHSYLKPTLFQLKDVITRAESVKQNSSRIACRNKIACRNNTARND